MNSMPNASPPITRRATWTAPWQRALIWMLCALALTSCAHGTKATRATIPAALLALLNPIKPVLDTATTPCPPLPLAADDKVPTLLRNHSQSSALYHQCAARLAGLATQARERERIETARIARAAAALHASGE